MAQITIYTDGSCNNKTHDHGGYGIIILNGHERRYCGGSYKDTTSARMEIMGVVKALEKCEEGDDITVHLDNEYVVNALSQGWVFRWEYSNFVGKKNKDLWQLFLIQYRRLMGKVQLKHVPGHKGDFYNEIADKLARLGAIKKIKINDNADFVNK